MKRLAALLLATSSTLAVAGAAHAQVSIALPNRAASNAAVDARVPQQSTTIPLPGTAPTPTPEPPISTMPVLGADGNSQPEINPYHRDIEMTVPLMYRTRSLGDVPVLLTHDSRFLVDTQPFLKLIDSLLNDAGKAQLASALGATKQFSAEDLAKTGISLTYDSGSLSVVVLDIDPRARAMEALFDTPHPENQAPDIQPAAFSAFVNVNLIESRLWGGYQSAFTDPSLYINGAARLGGFVLEGDFQIAQQYLTLSNSKYQFDRNYVRLVYDQPDDYRRWYLGDLTPEIRGQQSYVQMGGLGVSRQRERFDQFRSAILQGNRQIILQRPSTVEVYRNGSLYKQFRLDPGSYDLSSLPLVTGSNNIDIKVRDDSGAVQTLNYQSYLDPIDLAPGDYEYSAYIGKLASRFGLSPKYTGELAFTGFYRKAFLNKPAIGIGLQASRSDQVITGQTQFVLANASRLQLNGGVSNARGSGIGYSVGIGFDQVFDRGGLSDSLTLQANYLSRRFAGLGIQQPDNSNVIDVDAQYARAINQELTLLFGGTYVKNRGGYENTYRLYATTAYRLSRKWTIQGGVDYSNFSATGRRGSFGFNISLVFQPSYRDRAELRHDDASNQNELSYNHTGPDKIGSLGYGAVVDQSSDSVAGQAFVNYTGNRFDATLSHSLYGPDLNHVADQQVTSLRLGTSLAFAGGHFGIGRRINDSFAILYPHATLKGHAVVAGQSLSDDRYLSKSGALGGAVNGYLASYVTQSVQYDVQDPPQGYDIGPGVVRVHPAYHSGYALEIGAADFASAMGTLEYDTGKPVTLAAGTATAVDGKDKAPIPFFSNSVGRFAMQNLRPGASYRVELYDPGVSFEFTVPRDTGGLVDLKVIKIAH